MLKVYMHSMHMHHINLISYPVH